MKKIFNIIALCCIALMASCTTDAPTNTPDPDPTPTPTPPVDEVETRLISKIDVTYSHDGPDGDFRTYSWSYYLNYDEKNRVDRAYRIYYDDTWYEMGKCEFNYMSEDVVVITETWCDDEDPNWGEEDKWYVYLNAQGYAESYDGDEIEYNSLGYIQRWGNTAYRWRNGNMTMEELVDSDYTDISACAYNGKDMDCVNLDLNNLMMYACELVPYRPLDLVVSDLFGKHSSNYITSVESQYNYGGGDRSASATLKWSYDNDGYPILCWVNKSYSDGDLYEYICEIKYLDETGEVTPTIPQIETPLTITANKSEIKLGEKIYFTVTQGGKDVTDDALIYNHTSDVVVSNPYTPKAEGRYYFSASIGSAESEWISVNVVDDNSSDGIPARYKKWVGTYNATTHQQLVFEEDGRSLRNRDESFTVTIEYYEEEEWLLVYGLSVLGEDRPVIAELDDDDNMYIIPTMYGDVDEEGWQQATQFMVEVCDSPNSDEIGNCWFYTDPSFLEPYPLSFEMNKYGDITCRMGWYSGTDGYEMETLAVEIFWFNEEANELSLVGDGYPFIYRAGAIDLVKTSSSTSATATRSAEHKIAPAMEREESVSMYNTLR